MCSNIIPAPPVCSPVLEKNVAERRLKIMRESWIKGVVEKYGYSLEGAGELYAEMRPFAELENYIES